MSILSRSMVLGLTLGLSSAAEARAQNTFPTVVDPVVNAVMAAQAIPGAAVAIADRDTLLYAQGYGVRNLTSNTVVTKNTAFQIGSVTKQFTAALIVRIHEQRALFGFDFLGDRVSSWINGTAWFDFPWTAFPSDVRVSHLLDMTSGLAEWGSYFNDKQTLTHLASAPRAFAPAGSRMLYTNGNYFILAQLSKAATGLPYSTNLANYLLGPLGLTSTSTAWPPPNGRPYADGYTRGLFNIVVPSLPVNRAAIAGAGEIGTNVLDLARWDAALLRGAVVSPASFERMITPPDPAVPTSYRNADTGVVTDTSDPSNYGYGLTSWFYGHPLNERAIQHGGWLRPYGYFVDNIMFPESGLIVVVFTNQDWYNPADLRDRIISAVCSNATLSVHCN